MDTGHTDVTYLTSALCISMLLPSAANAKKRPSHLDGARTVHRSCGIDSLSLALSIQLCQFDPAKCGKHTFPASGGVKQDPMIRRISHFEITATCLWPCRLSYTTTLSGKTSARVSLPHPSHLTSQPPVGLFQLSISAHSPCHEYYTLPPLHLYTQAGQPLLGIAQDNTN